ALGGDVKGEHIVVAAGPGNNGGDGLVAARRLNDWGARVHVCLCAPRPDDDPKLQSLQDKVVDIVSITDEAATEPLSRHLVQARLVVDAILGTGKPGRGIAGTVRAAMELIQS